jgi:UDP-N-acetylmuramoylalanine--D-glutamate ligase
VLNISPDHLDRYVSMRTYAEAKQRVYAGAAVALVNRDDAVAAALAKASEAIVSFGLDEPVNHHFGIRKTAAGDWIVGGGERWMPVEHLRMPGKHNLANALAALALGEIAGLSRPSMLHVLREFRGLPHRTQWVAERNAVSWYNDSKATNTGAALAAVSGFDRPVVLIAGGQGKGTDFAGFAAGLGAHVKAAVLIGESAAEIERSLQDRIECRHALTMDEAVRLADQLALPGDVVLLSPACASFDMFENYQQRGEHFVRAVEELDR